MQKTNALRILDKSKINYEYFEYDSSITTGELVAEALHEDKNFVFKTLVTIANNGEHFVFVIPVTESLDLKKCARVAGVKSVEMIKQKELLPLTGYIHGGCSPIGMKKLFKTFVHSTAKELSYFYISGGHIGLQIKISPLDLSKVVPLQFEDLVR